jgi:DNA-directed RNA polymerase subunit RPC12/RpoP
MPDRINPRPVFRKAISKLQDARCPECGRAFDPVQDAETYLPRKQPLNCTWCNERVSLLHEFRIWEMQDRIPRR